MPIVGVVPAVKPAAALSKSRVIGLLATPATIKREYTGRLITEFASDCEVVSVGSSELVQMAEDKLRGQVPDMVKLERILEPFFRHSKLDSLVLACTHFPLLIKEIESVFKRKKHPVIIVDSGSAIAKRVATLLLNNRSSKHSNIKNGSGVMSIAFFTQQIEDQKLVKELSNHGFNEIQTLYIK